MSPKEKKLDASKNQINEIKKATKTIYHLIRSPVDGHCYLVDRFSFFL